MAQSEAASQEGSGILFGEWAAHSRRIAEAGRVFVGAGDGRDEWVHDSQSDDLEDYKVTPFQLRILRALADTANWTTRNEIKPVVRQMKGFAAAMGAPMTGIIEPDTLEGMGYVEHRKTADGSPIWPLEYRITLAGRKAISNAKDIKLPIHADRADEDPRYWCVNFDFPACLIHGIEKNLWLMQYQYADQKGHIFQDDRKAAIRRNWEQLAKVRPGDWFVAYLKPNTFYAIGKVVTPRRTKTPHDSTDTIAEYLARKKSHQHLKGCVYYTSVFYEDFTDKWRDPTDSLQRYAQRIDVDQWLHYVPDGVSVKGLNEIPAFEIQKAVFEIPTRLFDTIATTLSEAQASSSDEASFNDVVEEVDESVVEALEKSQARSQGFLLDSKLRKALEDHAMAAARRHFESEGYEVEDHSKNHPYDLLCQRNNGLLYVEVKGTQTNGEGVLLTSGEVEFARRNKSQMALFLLHSIMVSEDKVILTEGKKKVLLPWDVAVGLLKPLSYKYELPVDVKRKSRQVKPAG